MRQTWTLFNLVGIGPLEWSGPGRHVRTFAGGVGLVQLHRDPDTNEVEEETMTFYPWHMITNFTMHSVPEDEESPF